MTTASSPSDSGRDALLEELGASDAVRSILDVICQTTGMGFAAVAHVTENRWVACQVRDNIAFGLGAGGELPVETTLCHTVRGTGQSIAIDEVATDAVYRDHHTPRIYGLQSYIAVPIMLTDGELFGTLCAIDPQPRQVDTPEIRGMFALFAQLVATHVERIRMAATTSQLKQLNLRLEQRAARALAEKKVYADIVESSPAAVTALDLDGRVLAINRANLDALERIYGKRPAPGTPFLALFEGTPDHHAQQKAIWGRALAGETFAITQEFGEESLERVYYEVRFSPLLNGEGQRIGASSTSYDVTDRIRAEMQLAATQEQLRQVQKMEAMGQLTGGVAHDFNNLLTPIVGGLDMLMRKGVGGEREQRLIAAAAQSAERARMLVQRLLAFARRQPLQSRAVDVPALMTGMGDLIASTLGPQIRISMNLSEGMPPAHADANQLEMALLNLCVNARDAMPDGGALRMVATAELAAAGHPAGLAAGCYVRLTVADTGQGMDEATMARAIEPFFSTKGVGKGTGLGLSMVDGLARQLGGALALQSRPGAGTQVDLWLPASEVPVPLAEVVIAGAGEVGGAGLVLLVDDEALVRLSTADMLAELGYAVVEASSAEEALARIRAGLRPQLMVTDHLMPGMTGTDLARTLASEQPGIRTLIVSGYAETAGVAADFARLAKPFVKRELGASLAGLRSVAVGVDQVIVR